MKAERAQTRSKGTIKSVTKGPEPRRMFQLEVNGAIITASITNEAVDALNLKAGQSAYAVIKGLPT